jgi:hypothetical protein
MPLIVLEYGAKSKAWTEPEDCYNHASYMHVGSIFPPGTTSLKNAHIAQRGMEVGNVLIAKANGDPLDPEVADIFADFCRSHLYAYYLSLKGYGPRTAEPPEERFDVLSVGVLAMISPRDWEVYLAGWKDMKADTQAAAVKAQAGEESEVWGGGASAVMEDEVLGTDLSENDLAMLTFRCVKLRKAWKD